MGYSSPAFGSSNVNFDQSPRTTPTPNSPFTEFPSGGLKGIDLNEDNDQAEGTISPFGGKWRWEDYQLLISGWLNVGKDPVVDDDQHASTYSDKIHHYCIETNAIVGQKSINALKQH
ncbi:hypothetical protein CDL15_Pgr013165 [Punica granatum]|uniref:Uncharacterized protein n=1 Tax=Punica granatum TaxID=22663 RepID=A0A218WDN5_PUNGR|nr:hypothetical protein CDL15_Pgr013165 [Punica granatum]